MNFYSKAFTQLLEQDENMDMAVDPGAEANAAQETLDPGTEMGDLGASGDAVTSGAEVADAMARNSEAMKSTLTTWIETMDEFVEFLNGLEEGSVQSQLKNAVPDTILDKIRGSEMKKISRVSMEVAGLKEILRGYLASSDDAKYKYV